MDYLKDKQYYIDRYDLFTIKDCLEVIDIYRSAYKKMLSDKTVSQKFSPGDQAKGSNWLTNQHLFQVKAERYRRKEETIQKWMDADRIEQEKYDQTPEPKSISCPDCKKLMKSGIKHLDTIRDPLRMMFLFNCLSCKKKRWIYEDGTEFESKPQLCPKCKAEVEMSAVKESKDAITWKTVCKSCGFTETTVDDFTKSRAERAKREEEEKQLLEVYGKEFCSDEEGKKSLDYIEALKVGEVVFKEEVKKYDSLAYQKVSQLKKLGISDLEQQLNTIFEKEKYIKLSFANPEIGQHVIITFNVQDSDSSRKQEVSTEHLQKIIKDTLEGTNWRLMSDGLSYRLGFISGRLKGYEREEDFFELSGQKKEEEASKIDYETRMKYEGDNTVKLSRLMGELKGIESARKRRLAKEPNGFFLQESEGLYTCGICGENHYGNEIWWNLEGLRCIDCWRNIQENVIPSLKPKYKDDSNWFGRWEIKSEHEVHPGRIKKLEREGILNARHLKRQDGSIYFSVYLIEENQEFLKKYPKKERQKFTIIDLLGNKIEY